MERKYEVSLCMIVKNEEKYLKSCLESVQDLVDEMIIVDTGSTDATKEIAKSFGAKIYDYLWKNDFSDARNLSIEKATKDWILFMDADDIFENTFKERFKKLINSGYKDGYYFKTASYVNENNKADYVSNLNIRLLKNNKKYEFYGAIHEQLKSIKDKLNPSNFGVEDIIIHHTGYLPSVIKEKEKRKRNIPIIEMELEKNPDDPFNIFNLASEYFAEGNIEKALELYNIAYKNMDAKSGYASKLVLKRIGCYYEEGRFTEAINAVDDAIKLGFNYPDLYFYKGMMYHKEKRFTLAITSFKMAIKVYERKNDEVYINGCGSFRSYYALGEIHEILKDYEEAIVNYDYSIRYKIKNPLVYFRLGKIFKKISDSEADVYNKLVGYFNLKNIEDILILGKVLNNLGYYNRGFSVLYSGKDIEKSDRLFLEIGKSLVYLKEYNKALEVFNLIPVESPYSSLVKALNILITLIKGEEVVLDSILKIEDEAIKKTILLFYFASKTETMPNVTDETGSILKQIMDFLDILLKSGEIQLFEKSLNVLNALDSKRVLLELAKLYKVNGFDDLAMEEALRSIKLFGEVDRETVGYLYFSIV